MVGNYRNRTMYKIIYITIAIICIASCKSSYEPFTKRIISNTEYKEHFYIIDEEPNTNANKRYYWFKSQKVHSSQGDYGGALLDGLYQKYYYSNQLSEKGNFNKGIKTGIWNSWYENGQLAVTEKWVSGKLSGKNTFYDSIGNVISVGKYKNGLRSGVWLYPVTGDTIFYKKGKKVIKVKDTTKTSLFTKLFTKKEKPEEINKQHKKRKPKTSKNIRSKKGKNGTKKKKKQKQKKKPTKEPNFFQRLFGKKDKG